jgi:hypothetical protein
MNRNLALFIALTAMPLFSSTAVDDTCPEPEACLKTTTYDYPNGDDPDGGGEPCSVPVETIHDDDSTNCPPRYKYDKDGNEISFDFGQSIWKGELQGKRGSSKATTSTYEQNTDSCDECELIDFPCHSTETDENGGHGDDNNQECRVDNQTSPLTNEHFDHCEYTESE